MIKLIIFDYDGVIADTFPSLHQIYKIICRAINKECPNNIEEFRKVFGKNYLECVKNLGFSKKDFEKASEIYHKEMAKQNHPLFAGIIDVLQTLSQQYTLALISGNNQDVIMKTVTKYKLQKYFKIIQGAGQIDKSEELVKISKTLGIQKNDSIMVGDRAMDIELAKKAGYKNILIVGYGWERNDSKIKKPQDIIRAIEEW